MFSDLYDLIKEDENEIDDKPKQVNLLDLNKDILNIVGDFVKKTIKKEKEKN